MNVLLKKTHHLPKSIYYPDHSSGLQFILRLVQRLGSEAITDLTPGIGSHARLNRSKKSQK
ncbi:hypothetical protein J6590_004359 [Homalodisca vitripennis]|nr:hypothetical protein J6590_004359 [Homalodisca vitripennis]